jgi:hypothetical protein
MRFVVDESTGTAVAEYLRSLGYDVLVSRPVSSGWKPGPILRPDFGVSSVERSGRRLQQAGHPAVDDRPAGGRLGDAGDDLEPWAEPVEARVLLPAPLRPMPVLSLVLSEVERAAEGMPTTSPWLTLRLRSGQASKETAFRALRMSEGEVSDE